MIRSTVGLLAVLALVLFGGAAFAQEDFYTEMPQYLRMTQKMHTEKVVENVFVRRTYPDTANDAVDAEIRELVDDMAERSMHLLPAKGDKDIPAYLDAGAVITRTGTSWMSFLTLAEVSALKEHVSMEHDARVYDMETGERIALTDVFAPDSAAWELLAREVRAQLSDAFPAETPNAQRLDALCGREALEGAAFTMGAARLTLSYRADEIYPGKNTLLHVHLYYPEIREMMTQRAQAQTDNSRFKMIALTYDDGGARGSTRRVMDELRIGGAQATFFVVGYTFEKNHDTFSRQQDAAYSIQSHTYSHLYPEEMTTDKAFADKARLEQELAEIIGVKPTMMRAPGGQSGFYMRREIGYPLIQWSLAGGDSGTRDVVAIYKRVAHHVKDGDVVLMHDLNYVASEYTHHILKDMNDQGILCVTVEELFADAGLALEANKEYYCARNGGLK